MKALLYPGFDRNYWLPSDTGTPDDDSMVGTGGNDLLSGVSGNDTLLGKGGDDILIGGRGDDLLDGGAGDDELRDDFGINVLVGGGGDDVIEDNSSDAATLEGGSGVDRLVAHLEDIAGGITWINDDPRDEHVFGNKTVSGFEELYLDLGGGDDYVDNSRYKVNDSLEGGSGDDTLISGGGNLDWLFGQGGDDVLRATGDGDMFGGLGNDLLDASDSTGGFRLSGADGDDTLLGGDGDDAADGGDGIDLIRTGAGDDSIANFNTSSICDADTLDGGAGIDMLEVFYAPDTSAIVWDNDPTQLQMVGKYSVTGIETLYLSCGHGNDRITNLHTSTDDTLFGGNGHDTFNGGNGDDFLFGEGGADVLIGGRGADGLSGDAGSNDIYCGDDGRSDRIYLSSASESDTIYEFESLTDVLQFSQSGSPFGGDPGLPVGDGDEQIDGAVTIAAPGGYASSAELVVVATPVEGVSMRKAVAAAIGNADDAYGVGQTTLFVVNNGAQAAVYYFQSMDNDEEVSSAELHRVVLLADTPLIDMNDFVFGP